MPLKAENSRYDVVELQKDIEHIFEILFSCDDTLTTLPLRAESHGPTLQGLAENY